jgi:hypothetical protein
MAVKVLVEAMIFLMGNETACKGLGVLAKAVPMFLEALGVLI